ncbi:MAG TPA: alpha/beta fold hydrolase [Eubacteriales bacterium]|nr:alpha/beta fold hydrolase [Eubacteriales bacterium]HRU84219.1 alpha/beta fold hydrolase [Eubacteriales bacterium]
MKTEKFMTFDNTVLQCYLWDEVRNPVGVVQICHGMAEHARRYDDFAAFLNKNGYIVFADDHRAHGSTVKKSELGYHTGEVMEDTVKDQLVITSYLRQRFNLPVIFLGHSYGSFIGQRYIQENPQIAGAIFSGSAHMGNALTALGGGIASLQYKLFGGRKSAKMLDKMAFGSYDKPFKKEGVKFAWLSRNLEVGKRYYYDDQCGYVMSIAFYKYFFDGLKHAYAPENLAKIDKNLKLAIYGGSCDPVSAKGKQLIKLNEMYLSLGLKPTFKLYEGARHEILNETNNKEVYADMLNSIKSFLE